MSVKRRGVAALNGVEPEAVEQPAGEPAKPFISAGMAADLDAQGWTIDPVTGRKIVRDED